jgi:hypothetical protein
LVVMPRGRFKLAGRACEWSSEDAIAAWTLVGDDWQLMGNRLAQREWASLWC